MMSGPLRLFGKKSERPRDRRGGTVRSQAWPAILPHKRHRTKNKTQSEQKPPPSLEPIRPRPEMRDQR